MIAFTVLPLSKFGCDPGGMLMPGRKYQAGGGFSNRYGFNGQMKSDEIGGDSYTALYWEYDARTGRRWNVDPVLKVGESPYLCFSGNPILNTDINGDNAEGPGPQKLTIPSSPDKVDTKIWTPVKEGTGKERLHTQRWINADGKMLAFDKGKGGKGPGANDNWHVYNKDGQRLQANGELAGGVTAEGKAYYKKDAFNAHLKPGQVTEIKIKIPSAASVMEGSTNIVKGANKLLLPAAIAASAYDIATAENKPKAIAKNVGGWSGAYMGGAIGAKAGGAVGAFFGGVGAIPGAFIGGVIGGIGGWFIGSSAGEETYEKIK